MFLDRIRGRSGGCMDQEFAAAIFQGLNETNLPIGGVYGQGRQIMIPFLCQSHKFVGIFDPILGHASEDSIRLHIRKTSGHEISPNGHMMKFAALDRLITVGADDFDPIDASHSVKKAIYRSIPERLGQVTYRFLTELPEVDELFFLAAGANWRRIEKLDLWYQRISDSVAVQQLNLQRIHPEEREYWYGYRKTCA